MEKNRGVTGMFLGMLTFRLDFISCDFKSRESEHNCWSKKTETKTKQAKINCGALQSFGGKLAFGDASEVHGLLKEHAGKIKLRDTMSPGLIWS